MNYAGMNVSLWPVFSIVFEQWSNYYVLNYQKTNFKLAFSPDVNHYSIDLQCQKHKSTSVEGSVCRWRVRRNSWVCDALVT